MAHPAGKGVWRFVHRETGKYLDVTGHTANECMLDNVAAFVVAFGELPSWSRLDCRLLSDTVPAPKRASKRKRSNTDRERIHRVVGAERPLFLSGSGRA
jgi:hypothetical protein